MTKQSSSFTPGSNPRETEPSRTLPFERTNRSQVVSLNVSPANSAHVRPQVLLAVLSTLVTMASFEVLKQGLLPRVTMWGSHSITIVFTAWLAGVISFVTLRKFRCKLLLEATSRRAAEAGLTVAEDRFNKAFRSSPEGMTISALSDGRYIEANEAFVTKTALELNIWLTPEERFALVNRIRDEHRVRDHEASFRTKSGQIREVQISGELIQLQGETCLLAITRDVTERKQLEQQLRQAQRMESVGQLAGGVAHDFNNLLGIILGYADLLLTSSKSSAHERKKLELILESGQRAAAVTRQLLAFSRQQVLQLTVLNLSTVVSEVERLLRPLINEDIALIARLDANLPRVKADRCQLEQVIMNLVVNARDAMPIGGTLTLETFCATVDDEYSRTHVPQMPGLYVVLAVSDTGVGMDQATQARIFEPFFTTKELGKGTGLGLATVYGIVKQSDGFIWVYSEPGHGTTFKVYLPTADITVEKAPAQVSVTMKPTWSATVLVVEDEPSLRELTCESLKSAGYRVLEAEDVNDAIRIAHHHPEPIDLLLTDVVMPGMSGRELASRVLGLRPNLKVIYTSGYTEGVLAQHGVTDQCEGFLQKPFSRFDLLRAVGAAL